MAPKTLMVSPALCAILVFIFIVPSIQAFYLPGTAKDYNDGDQVPMDVNVLQSVNTHLPYEYYSLPFCKPTYSVKKDENENLGEILLGDRIRKAPYDHVQMNVPIKCLAACDPIHLDARRRSDFEDKIRDEYTVSLILDGLPITMYNADSNSYTLGFPIGTLENEKTYVLYNHLEFLIKFHVTTTIVGDQEKEVKRVVAFHVRPYSYKFPVTADGKLEDGACDANFDPKKAGEGTIMTTDADWVTWTYGVKWEESPDAWATRFDQYLVGGDTEIHWFAIVNSIMIVLFLTGMVAVIMMRTLRKDISRYNAIDEEDVQEETGWKLVHGDVFRPPEKYSLLACYTGTGVQLLGMSSVVLIFSCLGFLSPAHRGSMFTAMLLGFAFLGIYGGYTTARLMKMWNKFDWKTIVMTGLLVPGEIFSAFFIINLFVWKANSSGAVPFGTMLILLGMMLISVPLAFIGAVLGYKQAPISVPVRINVTERNIPKQPWYLHPLCTVLMGGVLPFGAVFIEVFFILTSIWLNRYYYVFGFLFIVFIILIITCAEITIVMIYFQLCAENYNWWWRSYFTSGSSGLYLFLYSVFYFFTSSFKMRKLASIMLFFGYMGVISYIFFVMTGTIGFLACLLFVRQIYDSIKVD